MSGFSKTRPGKNWVTMGIELFVAAVVLAVVGFGGARAQSDGEQAPAGNAQNGKMLFSDKTCDHCHGMAGEGGTGPQIAPPPKYADYISQIREPIDKMPAFDKNALSDAQAADIYAFLKSAASAAAGPTRHGVTPVNNGRNAARSELKP